MTLEGLVHDERMNAIIGWTLTGIIVLGSLESILTSDPLWGGFGLLIVIVAATPASVTHDWTEMVAWPLLGVATVAVIVGGAGVAFETVVYLAVATLALIVVVDLEAFTSVELSRRFAIGFAVLTTMALQALWTVAQYYSDQWFGTEYVRSQTELQWDFVVVTVVGFAIGVLFQWYIARFEPAGAVSRTTNGAGSP